MKDIVYIPVSLELVSLINQIKGKDMSVEEFIRELISDFRLKEISLKSIICDAIERRRYLKFIYEGGERIVEPYLLGIDKKGKMKLSGYQTEGYSRSGQPEGWKLFRVYDIECLQDINLFITNRFYLFYLRFLSTQRKMPEKLPKTALKQLIQRV